MNLGWKDLLCIGIVVAAVVWFMRPRQRKAGCGCSGGTKQLTPKPNATTAAPGRRCSGGIALGGH